LVADRQLVRVVAFRDGASAWIVDAIGGATWQPNVALDVQVTSSGVAVLWRDGSGTGTLALLGVDGAKRGDPLRVGPAACPTGEGVAWLAPHGAAGDPARVLTRSYAAAASREIAAIPADRSVALVCAARSVFVLGDGDDDVTVSAFSPGAASAEQRSWVLRDAEFADEEREHEAFTAGDELNIVRVGATGGVALRSLGGDGPSVWRKLKHTVGEDDDVVATGGTAQSAIVVFLRDAGAPCPSSETGAQEVRALVLDRTSGVDRSIPLAPADCRVQRGPFWVASRPSASDPIVAWVERAGGETGPAITALAFRVLGREPLGLGSVPVAADALVDGDCDESGCFVAALGRVSDSDGMIPGPIEIFAYP
jgi:hypothetical protein